MVHTGALRGIAGAVLLASVALLTIAPPAAFADEHPATYADTAGDAVPRRTDPGADGPYDPVAHRLIDLREVVVGAWEADDPEHDLFIGDFDDDGEFVRLDLVLDGLVNPPGQTLPWDFAPFEYGAHPVFGFIEIDMDQEVETGGELDAPQYRYLGNVVRFGGKPAIRRFEDRVALDASAFDDDFETPPFVDRHGEEFHLALLGSEFESGEIEEIEGNGDDAFDAGETWQIEGFWFHRAHGYEPFSLAEGGECDLRFHHDLLMDVTHLSLVFPLTNVGAGMMQGEEPEPPNGDPSDQASVLEALIDLRDSAVFLDEYPTGFPEEAIITDWEDQDPGEFLDPDDWEITVLLGTSYTAADPSGEYFVWTDAYPDVIRGDVDGDAEAEDDDQERIAEFVAAEDAGDGTVDGRVVLSDFGLNFSVFDINHGGVVDELDSMLVSVPGDFDADADVDLVDFARLQACFSGTGVLFEPLACGLADLDGDQDVDGEDAGRFVSALTEPGD
jgi:hypothetical protein